MDFENGGVSKHLGLIADSMYEWEGCVADLMLVCLLFGRQMLDQVLDFENGGVSKHLDQISDSMYEWEGPVAEQLGLTRADIAEIKMKYPKELKLQT